MWIASPSGLSMTTVIVPHPTEELKLIKYQKELVRRLFTPGTLVYAHQPLWIPVDFKSVQEAKEKITGVTLTGVEYDEKRECFICPVKIGTVDGTCLKSKLDFIHGLPRRSAPRNDAAIHDIFPMPLKIFRLGECTSPSPGVYELSNAVWKKL